MDGRQLRPARPLRSPPAVLLVLVALTVFAAACDPFASATSTPTAIANGQPTADPTPRPTSTPTARPTPTPTPSPTPTPTPIPTATLEPNPTQAGVDALVKPCPGVAPANHLTGQWSPGQSRNWSGYVATRGTFDCIEATWVQPKVRCRGTAQQSAVYWVGLGGYGQRSLVQVGTESSCLHGTAVTAAWHESLPKERFSIRTQTRVKVGDRIWAQVRWLGGSRYKVSLANLSNRQHFSVRVKNTTVKRSSAEWIVEAPTGGCPTRCRTLRMPDFGTLKFSGAWATLNGRRVQVDASRFVAVVERMVSASGATRAEVTSTGSAGTSFAVRWRRP